MSLYQNLTIGLHQSIQIGPYVSFTVSFPSILSQNSTGTSHGTLQGSALIFDHGASVATLYQGAAQGSASYAQFYAMTVINRARISVAPFATLWLTFVSVCLFLLLRMLLLTVQSTFINEGDITWGHNSTIFFFGASPYSVVRLVSFTAFIAFVISLLF